MANTYKLVYISQAKENISYRDIDDILKRSRKNNTASNVTGLLIFSDGFFIQYLEADTEEILKRILAKIIQDQRHHTLRVITEWECESRSFYEWALGFLDHDLNEKSHPFIQKLFGDAMLIDFPTHKEFVRFFSDFIKSQPLLK